MEQQYLVLIMGPEQCGKLASDLMRDPDTGECFVDTLSNTHELLTEWLIMWFEKNKIVSSA